MPHTEGKGRESAEEARCILPKTTSQEESIAPLLSEDHPKQESNWSYFIE
jgi:hypothetical protein